MTVAEKTRISPETVQLFDDYVIPNYGRYKLALVRGEGSQVWDDQGNRYLDFFPAGAAIYWGIVPHQWSKQFKIK